MTLSKTIHHYKDIAAHLYTIIQTDARRRVFASPAKAQRWRAQAYMYRSLVRKSDPNGSSLFDHLIFRITKDEPNVITILTEYDDGGSYFETATGQRVETVLTPEDEKMHAQARELRETLKKQGFAFDEPDVNDPDFTADPFGLDKKDH